MVREVIVANTYQLKSVGVPGKKTDKIDAAKLAEKLKAQVVSGVQQIVPVTIPPNEIRDPHALFATYRTLRKEIGQTKNRVHSILKENLYLFTKEFIFGKKNRKEIRVISEDEVLSFQINLLMDSLERLEETFEQVVEWKGTPRIPPPSHYTAALSDYAVIPLSLGISAFSPQDKCKNCPFCGS
jgi:transposase